MFTAKAINLPGIIWSFLKKYYIFRAGWHSSRPPSRAEAETEVVQGRGQAEAGLTVYAQPERQPQGRTREGKFTSTIQSPVSALRTL